MLFRSMSEVSTYREDGIKWIAPGKESAKSKRKRQPAKPKPAKSAGEKGKQARTVREQTVASDDDDTSNSDADKDSELRNIAKPREKRTDSEVSPKKNRKTPKEMRAENGLDEDSEVESDVSDQDQNMEDLDGDDVQAPAEFGVAYDTSDAGTSASDSDSDTDGAGEESWSDISSCEEKDFKDDDMRDPERVQWEGNGPKPKLKRASNPVFGKYLTSFMFFFTPMIPIVIEFTNKYATRCRASFARKNKPATQRGWKPLCQGRLIRFIAICVVMGVFRRSSKKQYFTTYQVGSILHPSFDGMGMGLTDFEQITKYLHFADPGITESEDKMFKMGGLFDIFNVQSEKSWELGKHVDVDEAMVPFKGRAPCKQYMPLKPKKRGLKLWCLNDSSNGFFYKINIYRGRHEAKFRPSIFSVGEWAVVALLLLANLKDGTILYCDRYFTTFKLLMFMLKRKLYCVGTAQVSKKKDKKSSSRFPSKYKLKESTVRAKGTSKGGSTRAVLLRLLFKTPRSSAICPLRLV